jgi:hypothetical protein
MQICSLPESPTRICFNHSLLGIHQLATEHPIFCRELAPLHTTISPILEWDGIDYFYSSATLKNDVEVTPCWGKQPNHSQVIGLLFRYSSGGRVCVGRFRVDHAGTTLEVGNSQNLYLGCRWMEHYYPYVASVELYPPSASLKWLNLPWMGKPEWWFSYKNCKLYHNSKACLRYSRDNETYKLEARFRLSRPVLYPTLNINAKHRHRHHRVRNRGSFRVEWP